MVEPGGVLVMVDAGTPLAFRYLRDLRSMLLQDAKTEEAIQVAQGKPVLVAPCSHSEACPMGSNSWCHFVQRVERTSLQLAAKPNSSQSFEDEKFTYFIFQKEPLDAPMPDNVGEYYDEDNPIFQKDWSRMVRHPMKKGGHVVLDACTPAGTLKRVIVSRASGKQMFSEARKTSWGDGFLVDKSTKHHETPSVFMKGVQRVYMAGKDEVGPNFTNRTDKAQDSNEQTVSNEWKVGITETELQPPSFYSARTRPHNQDPSSSTTTSVTTTTPPTITTVQQNSGLTRSLSPQAPEGPISWARDILMGKGPGQPRAHVGPLDTWLAERNQNPPPQQSPKLMAMKEKNKERETVREASSLAAPANEDMRLLQKHKYRLRVEKEMAGRLWRKDVQHSNQNQQNT